MTLGDYLAREKLTHDDFARRVGASAWGVGKWARGERTPRPDVMLRIRTATNGAVTADDFLPATSNEAA